jgi:outer membrane protein OmpA-like peptidoglycan-associated protein/Mg-chelatase subunit ChlD
MVVLRLLPLAFSLFLVSCAAFREPASMADATPPPGYNPIFLQTIAPLPQSKPPKLALQPTRVDLRDPRKVRVFMHMIDSSGTYYTGGSAAAFKAMWCKVQETIDGEKHDVKKFTISETTENDRDPMAIAIAMDNSGSMGVPRALAVQKAVYEFLAKKKPDDALALLRYDDHVEVEAGLTQNAAALQSQLQQNGLDGFGGGTAIHSSVEGAINHLIGAGSMYTKKAVIVFTDGQENSSKIGKDEVIELAQRSNVTVCAVDFGDGINEGYMESIARPTGGSYSHIYGTNEFAPMFEDVYRRLKNSYVLEFPVEDYGKHNVTVKMCWGKDTVQTQFSYDNTPDIGNVVLLNVFFDSDKSDLKPESQSAVRNVVSMMKAFPNMTIEVRGHTDNANRTKDADHNTKLSQRRADSVRDALVKAGVAVKRITSVGYGDKEPVASNDTEDGKSQNRRTEFKILAR